MQDMMDKKKIIIIASIVIVLALSGYLIYLRLAQTEPAPLSAGVSSSNDELDLSTFEIPEDQTAVLRLFRTVDNEVILADRNKRTLYFYSQDEENKSNCYDVCAENWPPLTVQPAESVTIGSGIGKGTTNIIERTDGKIQIVYKGRPLYTREGDQDPGDMTGARITNWEVAKP